MSWSRLVGVLLQGLILGTLLFIAVVNLVVASGGVRIFRYETF